MRRRGNESKGNDRERFISARKIINAIDWPCNLTTLFMDKNKDCKPGVISTINLFCEYEEELIILDDDADYHLKKRILS